ncbi:hypothetical protein MUN82_01645 [Hymenobacter aerilatus]|uniref:STAS/SEC14 domain-containing protein n=1 Tax=Hymenobacter aerilatus TaxID=2932251 RepID=A0A8T9SYK0_9BACT|nr:hypothetical protein [Hymenobacter aerilatus]UOR05813.1 hypothetical protein MUN82_01645 [Hymenobacter aerilatus]
MAIASPLPTDCYPVHDALGQLIATAYYHTQGELLCVVWTGHITNVEVLQVAEAFLQLQALRPIRRLYNDKTTTTGDWAEAMPWLEFEWLPKAIHQGLQAIAYVLSPDISNQLISRRFADRVRPQLPIRLFFDYDKEAALGWLQAQ